MPAVFLEINIRSHSGAKIGRHRISRRRMAEVFSPAYPAPLQNIKKMSIDQKKALF